MATPKVVRGWLRTACGQKVEHMPMPHPGVRVSQHVPPMGVGHTIEGSLSSGLSVFRKHYAPTFTVGGTRIIQHIPLGYMAAALVHTSDPPTNGWARVQIEVAGFSKQQPWLPDRETLNSLAHLMAALSFPNVAGIPLSRPFADKMPPGPWATTHFIRRRSGHWGKTPGWYGHVEVPQNEHWDMGAIRWSLVLARAKGIKRVFVAHPKPKKAPAKKKIIAAGWARVRPNDGLGSGGGHPHTL